MDINIEDLLAAPIKEKVFIEFNKSFNQRKNQMIQLQLFHQKSVEIHQKSVEISSHKYLHQMSLTTQLIKKI
jgi:hypothetical protein